MVDRNPLELLPSRAKARLVKRTQPKWVAPMLATLTDERFSREGWLFEPKWGGERCLVFRRAGSAAVALMVLSIIREPLASLGYLLLFGFGTIVGMMLITLILSAPFAFTAVNLPKFNWRLRVASGLLSFVFGVVLIYSIGFAEGGLFTDAPIWQPR